MDTDVRQPGRYSAVLAEPGAEFASEHATAGPGWTDPVTVPFSGIYYDREPFFAPNAGRPTGAT